MSKIILHPDYELFEIKGQPFCDSLQVAETFEKRHDHVLRDIESALKVFGEIGLPKFGESNFVTSHYKNEQNKKQPKYLLSRDGFSYIAMGFTGKKAAAFKIAYINRFNRMEAFIQSLLTTKMEFPAFTEAVMLAHDEPKHYHYSNEINMIYRIVLGVDAKKFRELRGLDKGVVIRPYLSATEIKAIERLQRADIGMLETMSNFEDRKQALSSYHQKAQLRLAS